MGRRTAQATLSLLDPTAVVLPHGTEVVTRVARTAGERVVPEGAIGRVVSVDGDALDVLVVGVGTLRYARSELVPRRRGQHAFAVRRAESWQALRPCALVETVVGSHAWGLADERSDVDVRGVFAWPLPWLNRLVAAPEDLVSDDSTEMLWELGKAVRQAMRADPNTLETLFLPGAKALDPLGETLLAHRHAFVSVELYGSFGRYALSQLRRLEQSRRLAEHRHHVLAWLREDPPPTLDDVATRLARIDPRAHTSDDDARRAAKQHVKQLYRSLHDQGLVPSSDFDALVRFAREGSADLELARELRPKNAYNLLRLIATATVWLRTGEPSFEAEGALRDRLWSIKRGEVPLEDVLRWADEMTPALEQARTSSPLPKRADIGVADRLMRDATHEIARRWVERVPGPFGRDAAEPPPIEWENDDDAEPS